MKFIGRHSLRCAWRAAVLLPFVAAAAGCGGGLQLPGTNDAGPAPARPSQPPVSMAGRWLLASPGRGQCNMTFAAAPGAVDGTIAPEGGCPGKFFTSRKWSFDSNGLAIRDHNSNPLAQLSSAGEVRFEGQATSGDPVTLTR